MTTSPTTTYDSSIFLVSYTQATEFLPRIVHLPLDSFLLRVLTELQMRRNWTMRVVRVMLRMTIAKQAMCSANQSTRHKYWKKNKGLVSYLSMNLTKLGVQICRSLFPKVSTQCGFHWETGLKSRGLQEAASKNLPDQLYQNRRQRNLKEGTNSPLWFGERQIFQRVETPSLLRMCTQVPDWTSAASRKRASLRREKNQYRNRGTMPSVIMLRNTTSVIFRGWRQRISMWVILQMPSTSWFFMLTDLSVMSCLYYMFCWLCGSMGVLRVVSSISSFEWRKRRIYLAIIKIQTYVFYFQYESDWINFYSERQCERADLTNYAFNFRRLSTFGLLVNISRQSLYVSINSATLYQNRHPRFLTITFSSLILNIYKLKLGLDLRVIQMFLNSLVASDNRCYFHTLQIESFCRIESCYFPMCSTCLNQHIEYHNKSGLPADIVPLSQALNTASQQSFDQLIPLRKTVSYFKSYSQECLNNLNYSLEMTKYDLIREISTKFDEAAKQFRKTYQVMLEGLKLEIEEQILRLEQYTLGFRSDQHRLKQLVKYFSQRQQTLAISSELVQKVQSRGTAKLNIDNISTKDLIELTLVDCKQPVKPYSRISDVVQFETPLDLGLTDRINKLKEENETIFQNMYTPSKSRMILYPL